MMLRRLLPGRHSSTKSNNSGSVASNPTAGVDSDLSSLPFGPESVAFLADHYNHMRYKPKTKFEKFRRFVKNAIAFLFSQIGLCCLVVAYTLLGSVIFRSIESENEQLQTRSVHGHRKLVVAQLWNFTRALNILYKRNWTAEVDRIIEHFQDHVVDAVKAKGWAGAGDNKEEQWSFSGSLLYSITVITTIGYGHITPKTGWGRIVTMFYALIGIPLAFLCLTNIGNFFADTFRFLYKNYSMLCARLTTNRRKRRAVIMRKAGNIRRARTTLGKKPSAGRKGDKKNRPQKTVSLTRSASHLGDTYQQHPNPLTRSANQQNKNISKQRYKSASPMHKSASTELSNCQPSPLHVPDPPSAHPTPPDETNTSLLQPNCLHDSLNKLTVNSNFDSSCATLNVNTPEKTRLSPDRFNMRMAMERQKIRQRVKTKKEKVSVPLTCSILIIVVYILSGAAAFAAWENWDFLEGSYFCFITLTTIGFGDYVPGTRSDTKDEQMKLIFCALYLLFGLAIICMAFELMQEEVRNKFRWLARRMGIVDEENN